MAVNHSLPGRLRYNHVRRHVLIAHRASLTAGFVFSFADSFSRDVLRMNNQFSRGRVALRLSLAASALEERSSRSRLASGAPSTFKYSDIRTVTRARNFRARIERPFREQRKIDNRVINIPRYTSSRFHGCINLRRK